MLALLLLAWLAAVPARAGIPILHQAHVGADPDHSHGCTHFSEIVSPSHGEVVSGRHFTLHVRCLAECGVGGAHVKIFLNEVCVSAVQTQALRLACAGCVRCVSALASLSRSFTLRRPSSSSVKIALPR